jgi:hypothetical protein
MTEKIADAVVTLIAVGMVLAASVMFLFGAIRLALWIVG